ncbi:MAG: glycosyltransferase family 4 protein [Bacteroidota bacterium]
MRREQKCSGHFLRWNCGIKNVTCQMPKLLRITTSPLSLQSLLSNQMRYMKENGFKVLMVSSEGKEWPDLIKNEGCDYRIVPMAREITPFRDMKSLWQLYRLIKKEKPDIVHSHTPKAGLLAMLAAKFAGVKIRVHTIAGLRFMTVKGVKRKLLVMMEKLTGKAATHVWPNSHSLLKFIQQRKLVKESQLQVIGHGSSNGVDLNRFSPSALDTGKIEEVKQLLDYNENLFYLLNMGRIVKDKGIDELMAAFKTLHKENPLLRLVVLGNFEDKLDPVSGEARQILLSHPAVIHISWSDKVEYFMHLTHLMVHASYREGFPNTLLQAGAMGCPIVCSAIEGSVDIVTDHETGLLFQPMNTEDLLVKLRYAMGNRDLIKNMAAKLRVKVENNFSQQYLHRCLKEKYLELLAKNN